MGGLDGLDGVGLPLSDCVTAFLSMSIWAVGLGCWPSIVAGLGLGHVVAFDGRRSVVGVWWLVVGFLGEPPRITCAFEALTERGVKLRMARTSRLQSLHSQWIFGQIRRDRAAIADQNGATAKEWSRSDCHCLEIGHNYPPAHLRAHLAGWKSEYLLVPLIVHRRKVFDWLHFPRRSPAFRLLSRM